MPPRATPSDYQAHAQAGSLTIAAEFMGHSIPTPDAIYSSEDYVAVEVGIFGPPNARAGLSIADFSLRVSGRKEPLPTAPYELVRGSLTDPEWAPPKEEKPKTTIGSGAQDSSAPPPKMPMDLRLAMEQRVHSAAMLQGDRALPQAGLLFFEYRGKTQKIRSLELLYKGPAGSATLPLQP